MLAITRIVLCYNNIVGVVVVVVVVVEACFVSLCVAVVKHLCNFGDLMKACDDGEMHFYHRSPESCVD